MSAFEPRAGLEVAPELVALIEDEVLPGLDLPVDAFWTGVADIFGHFAPENRRLLAVREGLQASLDAWHLSRRGQPHDPVATETFLREIGYLVDRAGPLRHRHGPTSMPRSRPDGRAAAGGAGPERPLPAQRRQCPLGQPV